MYSYLKLSFLLQGQGNREGAADRDPELRRTQQGRDREHGPGGGGQRRDRQGQQRTRGGHQPGGGKLIVFFSQKTKDPPSLVQYLA